MTPSQHPLVRLLGLVGQFVPGSLLWILTTAPSRELGWPPLVASMVACYFLGCVILISASSTIELGLLVILCGGSSLILRGAEVDFFGPGIRQLFLGTLCGSVCAPLLAVAWKGAFGGTRD